ncbi:hypothetical protein BU16DRAFT_148837 [Lophium mytilinum]|uniref:NUDE domain-containing protein n=1 Tax=Lophium mytilinum TaxID=390894 RepID=A0A6A6QE61_9PEZI|nr:hypothetical protein BU16DRAFT_148837 [Lophium mytilinum]
MADNLGDPSNAVSMLLKRIEELEIETAKLKREKASANAAHELIDDQLDNLYGEQLEHKRVWEKDTAEKECQIEELKDIIEGVKDERNDYRFEVEELTDENYVLRKDRDKLQAALEGKDEEIAVLKARFASKDATIDRLVKENARLQEVEDTDIMEDIMESTIRKSNSQRTNLLPKSRDLQPELVLSLAAPKAPMALRQDAQSFNDTKLPIRHNKRKRPNPTT